MSFIADAPIFLLPIVLLRMYVWRGIIKKRISAKYGAVLVVMSCVVAVAINIIIQHLVDKARPETALTNA